MSQCLVLSSNNACGALFAGWPVLKASGDGSGFADESQFNALIKSVYPISSSVLSDADHGCTDSPALQSALYNVRYQVSFNCMTPVLDALNAGCSFQGPAGAPNADAGSVIMCQDYCDQSVAEYQNMYANNNCTKTQWVVDKVAAKFAICDTTVPALLKQYKAQKCYVAVGTEVGQCGFGTLSLKQSYCAIPANANDVCCVVPDVQYATLSADGKYYVKPPSSSDGPSIGVIAGGAVGGVLALALIGFGAFYYMKKNKKQQQQEQQKNQFVQDYRPGFSDSPAYPPKQHPSLPRNYNGQQQPYAQQQPQQFAPQQPTYVPAPNTGSLGRPKPQQQQQQQQLPPAAAPSPIRGVPQEKQEIVRIIHSYAPQMPDELNLVEGNDLILLKRFDDGWAQGVNPLTGVKGAFPLVCVVNVNELNTSKPQSQKRQLKENRISKRMSSMIITPPVTPASAAPAPASPSSSGNSSGPAKKKQLTVRILFAYSATQEDELDLVPGNDLIVLKTFDDGWALGMHPFSGQKGAFPLACVGKPEDAGRVSVYDEEQAKRVSKRVSSLLEWE